MTERGPLSRICLGLTAPTLKEDAETVQRYRRHIDLAELRADFLGPEELASLPRFPSLVDVPVILTLRRGYEGGKWSGEEGGRIRLLAKALECEGRTYAFLDLEEGLAASELEALARSRGTRIIRSFYDLHGVHRNLSARLRRLARRGQELPKAAVMVGGSREMLRLVLAFRELEGMQKILLGMGEYGLFSRVLAGRLGSWLTYFSPAEEVGGGAGPQGSLAAPGQPDPETLAELYRFRRIDRETALYGVIGNPIAHSRSPELHNRAYSKLGLNAVYLPFLVDELGPFLKAAGLLGVRGLSVTVPFKEKVLRFLARKDEPAAGAGACNTLLREGGGWRGTNTDVGGFLQPLERLAPELLSPGTEAVVIGAGGAARAVVYALASRGVRPLILNRTPARARALAGCFGCSWDGLETRALGRSPGNPALIVQASSAGMGGSGDPLPEYRFRGDELVYELVYGPSETPFLARAKAAGCRTIEGLAMLRAQAEEQFRLFTGREYPAETA